MSVPTNEPTAFIAQLGLKFEAEIPNLSVRRSSLEDAYLELIAQDRDLQTGDQP
jgi:hypothetical protein